MNITELDSFSLSDAVKFHDRLNPRIWGRNEQLLPEVKNKLLAIAADFQEFLGVSDLDVKDITVSGSNAAYTYTPHSDIDLHLVVNPPQSHNEVYQELFNAKKYQYNDEHNIKIGGADVELYVQLSDESPVSQGEYSVMRDQWIQVPRRKKHNIDDTCVQAKVEDLDARIQSAIASDNADRMHSLWTKIKTMRQTGLDQHGEFGCENIAFKILRKHDLLKNLKAAMNAARDRELSLAEQNRPRVPRVWGFSEGHYGSSLSSEDGVAPTTCMYLNEEPDTESIIHEFIKHTAEKLGIERMPKINIHTDPAWSIENHSFGRYQPDTHELDVTLPDRHLLDILRTVAHELTHCRQNEIAELPMDAGETGSDWENEAHASAGIIMRDFADAHPELFDNGALKESASGYIPTAKEKNDPRYSMALTVDIKPGQVGKEANKMGLKTNKQGKPKLIYHSVNQLHESLAAEISQELALLEDEFLGEIKMSPSNLKAEAAKTGAQAGMEFEMIVPNVKTDEESEYEPDYDQDQRSRSISDIRDFFYDGDFNSRRNVDRLEEALREQYNDWLYEQLGDAWDEQGEEYLKEYIEVNDEFDEEAATEEATNALQAEYGDDITPEDFQKMLDAMVQEKLDEFVQEAWADRGRLYDRASEHFMDEMRDELDDEDQWLRDNYPYMSDIEREFDIQWPYYTDANEGSADMDIESVANDFSNAVGKKVNWSSSYHGGRREPNAYVVEPDGSLDPNDSDDGGLEFVSPPMPIDEMIDQLNTVKAWAKQRGCYTNKSTGLHINISVPDYDLNKLDFVKLALLLGDEYVLDQFGRSTNTYAASAMGKVKQIVQQSPEKAQAVLDKMRGHMEDFATKAIHSGQTSKYTSINTKDGYIEFRSPGGDWLDQNFDKVENTLMRFTVALSAAMNPEAYREEYLKKLYKLLEPAAQQNRSDDTIKYFSDYVAGKLPKAALRSFVKQAQLQRKTARGQAPEGQKYWWNVQWDANRRMEVVAANKNEARAAAAREWGVPESQLAIAKVTMLRPYEEPQAPAAAQRTSSLRPTNPDGNYVIFANNSRAGDPPAYRFMAADNDDADTVLLQWSRENPGEWEVHYDGNQRLGQPPVPGSTLDLQRQRAAASQEGNQRWSIKLANGQEVHQFWNRNNQADANAYAANWLRNNNMGVAGEGFTVVPLAQQSAGDFQFELSQTDIENRLGWPDQTGDANYEVVNRNTLQPVYLFIANTDQDAQRKYGEIIQAMGLPGAAENYGYRARGSVMPPIRQQAATPAQQPAASGEFTGEWKIMFDGEEISRISGIGNNQADANRFGRDYVLQQIRAGRLRPVAGAEIEVLPVMA